ncbi:MAG: hypothetical protein DWQ07_10370 [Chloroflexi bacterium]|nr:MAG: hypothetical protein DWQ07_10370 [Chloroflexota bacterium]MBL1192884.1 hypothetical protein [Chloroflexota bacterium]NOH10176.1 hypothetical protein [Chloroflexota bacterium]
MSETKTITWRLHLASSPQRAYDMLATDAGRAQFWAEEAVEKDGQITWRFPNGWEMSTRVLASEPPHHFSVKYIGGSTTTFELQPDGKGGTDLTLTDAGVQAEHHMETYAGWLSVLLALKAAVDFGVDMRNHDPERTWDQGYVEN